MIQNSIKQSFTEREKSEDLKKDKVSTPSESQNLDFPSWDNEQSDGRSLYASAKNEIENTTCTSSALGDEPSKPVEQASELDDLINFDKYFPKLMQTLDNFEDIIDIQKFRDEFEALEDKSFLNTVKIKQAFLKEEDKIILT